MREILFRGKRIDNGEWAYGFLYKSAKSSTYNAESFILEKEGLSINYKGDKGVITYVEFIRVDPSTVGQYTGLTDKNGKKIFEGDIVRLFDIAVGEITHECGAFGIGFRSQIDYDYLASEIAPVTGCNNSPMFCYNDNYVSLWELYWNYNEENDNLSVIEVIGNIHDNPELFEEEKDSAPEKEK